MWWRRHKRGDTAERWAVAARGTLDSGHCPLLSWDTHPLILQHINYQVSGDSSEHWIDFVHRRFVPHGAAFGLSVGCGAGGLERHALRAGLCKTMEGCDLSDGALHVAAAAAANAGYSNHIRYFHFDLNSEALPTDKYDIVFSSAALHHVHQLAHAFAEIRRTLRPGGLLVLIEYVGPSRFQWTDQVHVLMDRLLAIMPPRYRVSLRQRGIVKDRMRRPSVADVVAVDPSEAIRSEAILSELAQSFETLHRVNLGGTLLHFLLEDVVGNFDVHNEDERAFLELLILFEEVLIAEGVLSSDFVLVIAKPIRSCTR
jgi:SAM-dependent methyltransferase